MGHSHSQASLSARERWSRGALDRRGRHRAAFAADSAGVDSKWKEVSYQGNKQDDDHPVVNVSWEDARKFCQWLSQKEGRAYRLPTDHEWSCAVGIGDREQATASPDEKDGKLTGGYPWGKVWPPPAGFGNYLGEETTGDLKIKGYRDQHPFTAPVGSYTASLHGLYDLGGNVWEWCDDRYDSGSKPSRASRSGSWVNYSPGHLLSSNRFISAPEMRFPSLGFRVVLGE